jgi:hypothetical protein
VILTDIMKKGADELSRCDLEDRLSCLWFQVIGKIGDCELQFNFRTVGFVTTRMIEMEASLWATLGIRSDGFTILAQSFPAGMSFFIPTRPTIKLRVHFSTTEHAILFARADDGTELFSIAVWRAENEADRLMEGKTVRFEVSAAAGEVQFMQVSFSDTDTHNFAHDINKILKFVLQGYQPSVELAICETLIRQRST